MIGITDQTSIFTGGFFNQNGSIPDNIDIYYSGWFESDVVVEDYQEYDAMPNQFFQEESSDYDVESTLYDLLLTESINQNGVPMVYYVTSFNTSYDKVFGEDNNRNIVRKFNVMGYMELVNEDENFSFFGIEGIDNFHIQISMRHFETASQFDLNQSRKVYPSYKPKEGDIIHTIYNNNDYEIVMVKQQVGQFLQRQHSFDIICKPCRNEHISVSGSIPANDEINQLESILDIFSISASIDQETPDKLYDNTGNTEPDSLFGLWN